jgi:predicted SAM-dependent methyltransferase
MRLRRSNPETDARRQVTKLLKSRKLVMLNVGCGTDYKKGWINIDNNSDNNIEKLDLNWDLRNPLPFDDQTVDYIFHEHLIEHLTPEEGQKVTADLMRVLKPGGVLRIATPDLKEAVSLYLNPNYRQDRIFKDFDFDFVKTSAELLNISFTWWGHKWLYDWEELKRRLNERGYTKLKKVKLRQSKHPELNNLETREQSNLIVEVTK